MPTAALYRILIDSERCKGCELCLEVCPRRVLAMGKTMNSRGYRYAVAAHPQECSGCLQCADICPDAAIEIDQELE